MFDEIYASMENKLYCGNHGHVVRKIATMERFSGRLPNRTLGFPQAFLYKVAKEWMYSTRSPSSQSVRDVPLRTLCNGARTSGDMRHSATSSFCLYLIYIYYCNFEFGIST